MSVKSAYRNKSEKKSEPPIPPSEKYAEIENPKLPEEAEHTQNDETTDRLRQQLAALDHQAQYKQAWQTIEGHIQQLRHQGIDEGHLQHAIHLATHHAAGEGHQPNTVGYLARSAHHLDQILKHGVPQAAPQPQAPTPIPQAPPPPPPPAASPSPPASPYRELHRETDEDNAGRFSAPVSREGGSYGGSRSGTQVRLTTEQREAARLAGVSEVEYARNHLRLEDEKRRGLRQNG
jgi:hypothetical protein